MTERENRTEENSSSTVDPKDSNKPGQSEESKHQNLLDGKLGSKVAPNSYNNPKSSNSLKGFWGGVGVGAFVTLIVASATLVGPIRFIVSHINGGSSGLKFHQGIRACSSSAQKSCIENAILLDGNIIEGDDKRFSDFLEDIKSATQGTYICFNSLGGHTNTALKIGEKIAEKKLNTCLAENYSTKSESAQQWTQTTVCESSCPLILYAGKERVLLGNALVGIHEFRDSSGSLGFINRFTFKREIEKGLQSYRSHGVTGPALNGDLDYFEEAEKVSWQTMRLLMPNEAHCRFGFFTSTNPKIDCSEYNKNF